MWCPTISSPRSSRSCRSGDPGSVRFVKRSEFHRAVETEFGARAAVIVADLQLSVLGDRTPEQALSAGIDPREIWLALCEAMDVPAGHRYGAGRLDPKER
jgi:hypothetical protein